MKATYITHMGSDDLVVDAARASFSKKAENYTPEQNARLIRYLAEHEHWSPMAHPQITLLYEVPIFIARQEFKHIVGFVRSEQSRRYVDSVPEFYNPEVWRSRPEGSVKQGSGEAHPEQGFYKKHYPELMATLQNVYASMIADGIAPEQARMVMPQSMYTSYYVTGSLASFARFYNQRTDPHAQKEIQELAEMVGEIIQPLFPVSWAALTKK